MSHATFEKIRENYQRACDTSHPRPDKLFARTIREQIGLGHSRNVSAENPEGYYLRPDGFPMLAKDRKKSVGDFNIEVLTEALLGHQAAKALVRGGERPLAEAGATRDA